MTPAERVLWRGLREAFPDAHWRKQVPFGPYHADFCSHSAKLIIEVDGGQHAEEAAIAHDEVRTRFLAGEGYRAIRFWNNDVLQNTPGVIEAIANALSPCGRGRDPSRQAWEGEGRGSAALANKESSRPADAGRPLTQPSPTRGEGQGA